MTILAACSVNALVLSCLASNALLKTYGFVGRAWLEAVRGDRGGPLWFVYENVASINLRLWGMEVWC